MKLVLVPLGVFLLAVISAGDGDSSTFPILPGVRPSRPLTRDVICGLPRALRPFPHLQEGNELPEHTDHDCHWNERDPQPYYWYWSRNTDVIIDTMNPADAPDMNNLPPRIMPGTESGRELEIRKFRNAKLYNHAWAEDNVQGTGWQDTGAELRWVPSPTWRADVECCHPNDSSWNWTDEFRVYMTAGSAQGNHADYPKMGIARFGTMTYPCEVRVEYYSSGCLPLDIPAIFAGERLEFTARLEFRQTSADTQPELFTSGYTKEYAMESPPGTTDYEEVSIPEMENAQYANLAGYEQYEEGEPFDLNWVTEVGKIFEYNSIHKSMTSLGWDNWISLQEADASNCEVDTQANCVPYTLVLFDNMNLNHFVAPGEP